MPSSSSRAARSRPNRCAEELAADYSRFRSQLRRAAMVLHDSVGSPLAGAGMLLQMLRLDFPEAEPYWAELVESLDATMSLVRDLSRDLATSPVRAAGFKGAMEDLAQRHRESTGAFVKFKYAVASAVPAEAGDTLYHITELILAALPAKSKRIRISVHGARQIVVQIQPDSLIRGVGVGLTKAALIANSCGLHFGIRAGEVTILTVKYAFRRPASR